MNPTLPIRVASLFMTIVVRYLTEDPQGFFVKLAERMRTSNNAALSRIPINKLTRIKISSSPAREAIDSGNLSEGVRLVENAEPLVSLSERRLARQTVEHIGQLQVDPPASASSQFRIGGSKIKALHLLTNSLPHTSSGYTIRSHSVLSAMQKHGIDVHAITRLAYPILVGRIPRNLVEKFDGIPYERMLPWSYPSTLQSRDDLAVDLLVAAGERFGAEVLHTTTDFKNAIITARAAEKLRVPWVYEVRGELERTWLSRQPGEKQKVAEKSEFFRLARDQESRYMRAADQIVVLSEISRKQLVRRGVEAGKISVVPNAIDDNILDIEIDRPRIREGLGIPEGALVGSVTSVVDYEGLDTLIDALAFLPDEVCALIVGEGTQRPMLEQLARERGVSERVIFAGRQPHEDIWKWYAALDVFVVPRKDTPVCRTVTPLKPLTAQGLGIPVVASDLPALREVTGGEALYVPAGSPGSLAEAIAVALKSPQLANSAKTWASTRTWRNNGSLYSAMYERLV